MEDQAILLAFSTNKALLNNLPKIGQLIARP